MISSDTYWALKKACPLLELLRKVALKGDRKAYKTAFQAYYFKIHELEKKAASDLYGDGQRTITRLLGLYCPKNIFPYKMNETKRRALVEQEFRASMKFFRFIFDFGAKQKCDRWESYTLQEFGYYTLKSQLESCDAEVFGLSNRPRYENVAAMMKIMSRSLSALYNYFPFSQIRRT